MSEQVLEPELCELSARLRSLLGQPALQQLAGGAPKPWAEAPSGSGAAASLPQRQQHHQYQQDTHGDSFSLAGQPPQTLHPQHSHHRDSIFRIDVGLQGNTILSVPTSAGPATIHLPSPSMMRLPQPVQSALPLSSLATPSSAGAALEGTPGLEGAWGGAPALPSSAGDSAQLLHSLDNAVRELRGAADTFSRTFSSPLPQVVVPLPPAALREATPAHLPPAPPTPPPHLPPQPQHQPPEFAPLARSTRVNLHPFFASQSVK